VRAQVINRDLSVAALRYFVALRGREAAEGKRKPGRPRKAGAPAPAPGQQGGRGVRVLEGLAASGLRALRYALEARAPCRVAPLRPGITDQPTLHHTLHVDGRLRLLRGAAP